MESRQCRRTTWRTTLPLGLAEIALQVLLGIHAARTGRLQPWLFIIMIPVVGPILYLVMELGPEIMGGRAGRRLQADVGNAVAPGRAYRTLAREAEIAPTVHNRMRLAEECLALGRADEAVTLYQSCLAGQNATDPAIRLGLARALVSRQDYDTTIILLEALARDTPDGRTPDGHLLYAVALDGNGRDAAALAEYKALVDHYPGEEARCRYADLLLRTGDRDAAQAQFREVMRRVELQGGFYKREQRHWYDIARRATA